jgi:hypothetical protein
VFCIAIGLLTSLVGSVADAAQPTGLALADQPGEFVDVRYQGKTVARYMYACDTSTPQRLHETYKPYLHVFDAEGQTPITKGPGGLYTHHRGIFAGWNRLQSGGKSYDLWHMSKVQQVHQKFLKQTADGDQATLVSLVHWNDTDGKPLVEEERTMTVRPAPKPGLVTVDFTTRLKPTRGDVRLDGDPEHAGVQYRPANEVVRAETTYLFPKEKADPRRDVDYPWVGETYTLAGKRYSVVDMNHPENPPGTVFSAYRDYGRFGAFFKKDLSAGQTLVLKYRFWIGTGEMPEAATIQRAWDQFAGVASPSPLPKTTLVGGLKKPAPARK